MVTDRERWERGYTFAQVWYCDDDHCDCTEPQVVRVTPNRKAGYPWVTSEAMWTGQFLTDTREYSADDRERLQYAPLREACERLGIEVPAECGQSAAVEKLSAGGS